MTEASDLARDLKSDLPEHADTLEDIAQNSEKIDEIQKKIDAVVKRSNTSAF